jgi:PKHD-type hydroxylase
MYDNTGKYETHVDTFHAILEETRKLTVLAFLNDDFEGGKFYIQNSFKRLYPQQTPGTVLVFPSFMPHGVEPITKGIRYSVVTWMVGPYFK